VHQVSDWCSGAAVNFGWMREAKKRHAARRVAMKMGRWLRCSSVTYRSIRRAVACSWPASNALSKRQRVERDALSKRQRVERARYAPSCRQSRLGPPCRRPILIATPLHQSLTWCTRGTNSFGEPEHHGDGSRMQSRRRPHFQRGRLKSGRQENCPRTKSNQTFAN
jgi:hypothetical protein